MKSRSRKFCTCKETKPRGSYDHEAGCDFFKVKPETKDEKIARLEQRCYDQSAAETLLHVLMERPEVAKPVEISVETYDDPPVTITAKVWPHRKDDGIVWVFGRAQWLGTFSRECSESSHYYMKDLSSKANAVYIKHWSGK
jgi:hypothetical protein